MPTTFDQYKKPALVLGGGGTKAAAFHAGVCVALQEKGFVFSGGTQKEVKETLSLSKNQPVFQTYIGSSAGAIICSFLAKGYSIEDILKATIDKEDVNFFNHSWFKKSTEKLPAIKYRDLFSFNLSLDEGKNLLKSFVSFNALTKTFSLESLLKAYLPISGILSPNKIEKYFKNKVGSKNEFKQLGVDLFILCSKLDELGLMAFSKYKKKYPEIEYADYGLISEAIAASTAMPGIFSPYPITNKKDTQFFYDGGILEDLAPKIADIQMADIVVMSNPIIPYHYHESKGSLSKHGIPFILTQAIYQLIYKQNKTEKDRKAQLHNTFNNLKKYLDSLKLSGEEKDKIFNIIEKKINFKQNTKYIYIQPEKTDYRLFWSDHISLNKKLLSYAFKKGLKAGMSALK
ncbi:MAG: patatin-like phospholipase family protein [Bdellovibrionales bacterium]|nr:patatin-like phospholipase family protein [Bdellovibrionales bacterium]